MWTPQHKHEAPEGSEDGTHMACSHWLDGLGMDTHHKSTRARATRSDKKKEGRGERGLAQEKEWHFCVVV